MTMTNIVQKKMMQYVPEIHDCLLFMKCFFCIAVQFFSKKKIEIDWVFLIHLSGH
jgi:hypothetical protein